MKNKNPYARGNYFALFAFWATDCKGVATKNQLVDYGVNTLGMNETAAVASVTVILSPRETDSERGDCRGNFSAQGHVYFAKPCNKVKGEDRKFMLRYRKEELERRERPEASKPAKPAKKAKPAKVKAPAKKAKAPAKKKAKKAVKTVSETPSAPVEAPISASTESVPAPETTPVVEATATTATT